MNLREIGRKALKQAKEEIDELGGIPAIKSGEWLLALVRRAFRSYYENATYEYFQQKYPRLSREEIAEKLIKLSCRYAAILGAAAGAGISVSWLFGITGAAAEAIALMRLQLQLVANLAKVMDVPLNPDDPEDMLVILAYATGGGAASAAGKAGMTVGGNVAKRGIQQVVSKDVLKALQTVGRAIGVKVLQRTVIKYAVPVVSVGIGSTWNFLSTRAVGTTAMRHFRERSSELASGATAG